MSDCPEATVYSEDPFHAIVHENRLLNGPGSEKETRHFVVGLAGSGLHYKAGDSLGVFPSNRPEEVVQILAALGVTGDEAVIIPKAAAPTAFQEALASCLALAGPTR